MGTATESHTLGNPQTYGGLTIFPILGPEPRLEYRPLAEAIELGASIRELKSDADVRTVVVDNSTDLPVLVYEGEQITGAQQNRVFDSSLLVPAKSQVTAPVSCIERGRWDHTRRLEPFRVSPHAADPAMRGMRRELSNRLGSGGRPDQGEVWSEVSRRLLVNEVASTTDALEDLYAASGERIENAKPIFQPVADQVGAVVQLDGLTTAIDLVSRPKAYVRLAPALIAGYVLQTTPIAASKPDLEKAARFLGKALHASREATPNIGLGHTFSISTRKIVGAGVEFDEEVVAISAFRKRVPAT